MRPVPPDLARALSKALRVEQSARRRVRRAIRRQVDALDRLRALGVPATLVAIEVAKASGAHPSRRSATASRPAFGSCAFV